MIGLLALSPALALDCTGRDPDTCAAVNDLAARVNLEVGAVVVHDGAASRLRPATLYTQLDALRQAAITSGCRTGSGFDGWDGGRYAYSSSSGGWSGSWAEIGGATGDQAGDVRLGGKRFDGLYDGDATGLVGDRFGLYHSSGQFAGNREGDFVMGRWIRIAGTQGVYVGLHGACDAGEDIAAAFDPWYAGDLSPYVESGGLDPAWRVEPVYGGWVLTQGSGLFTHTDCNGNFLNAATWDVNGHMFDVGNTGAGTSGLIVGLPQGGITLPAPVAGGLLDAVHLIHPGGRCSGQDLVVSYTYDDTTSESIDPLFIAHDCTNAGSGTNGDGATRTHQGQYGGPCCDNWYQSSFDNPQPAKGVASITVTYTDGCGGSYPGQIWGVAAD